MPHMRSLLRILKRVKHAPRPTKTAATIDVILPPTVAECSGKNQTLKARLGHAIAHRVSRIPRWTGIKKAVASQKEDVTIHSQHPLPPPVQIFVSSKDFSLADPGRENCTKSAFAAKVLRALRKVSLSRIPRPTTRRRGHSQTLCPDSATDSELPRPVSVSSHAGLDGMRLTTRVEMDSVFFNEDDLFAIINPVVEEPHSKGVPRHSDAPRVRSANLKFARRYVAASAACIGRGRKVKAVPVDEPAPLLAAPSITVERLQSLCLSDATTLLAEPPVIPKVALKSGSRNVISNSAPNFIFAASGSSSSLSDGDESGTEPEPISSATGSPVSPIPDNLKATLDLDSDVDDFLTHFRRIHSEKMDLFNRIVDIRFEHARKLQDRLSVTSSCLSGFKPIANRNDTAINRSTLEGASKDNNDLELRSAAAEALCDPKNLSRSVYAAPHVSSAGSRVSKSLSCSAYTAPHVRSGTSGVRLAKLPPTECAAPASRRAPHCDAAVQGQYALRSPPPPPLPIGFKDPSSFKEARARARHVVEGLSRESPTAHRTKRSAAFYGNLTLTPRSLSSVAATKIPGHHSIPLSVADPSREAHLALSGGVTKRSLRSRSAAAARHFSLPDVISETRRILPVAPRSPTAPSTVLPLGVGPRPSMIPRHASLRTQSGKWIGAEVQLGAMSMPGTGTLSSL